MTPPEIICSYVLLYTHYLKMFQKDIINLKKIDILCYAYVCPSCIQWPCFKKTDET